MPRRWCRNRGGVEALRQGGWDVQGRYYNRTGSAVLLRGFCDKLRGFEDILEGRRGVAVWRWLGR